MVRGRGTNIFATPRTTKTAALYVAHRDSRPFSPGAIDNGSGTALLLFLAEAMKNPSFSLLSTDAEEYGLVGARHFARTEPLEAGTSIVNLDSVGSGHLHLVDNTRAGRLSATLNSRISSLAKSVGITLSHLSIPRGSDCDAFLECGFQASWLRSYPTPTATTVDDSVKHISRAAISQSCLLLRRLAGANLSGA
jgi:aminopeptidase YwaD